MEPETKRVGYKITFVTTWSQEEVQDFISEALKEIDESGNINTVAEMTDQEVEEEINRFTEATK